MTITALTKKMSTHQCSCCIGCRLANSVSFSMSSFHFAGWMHSVSTALSSWREKCHFTAAEGATKK